jgi:predicted nucleotide-binding protein (sugar kinase/HSP70/actin superfamily)
METPHRPDAPTAASEHPPRLRVGLPRSLLFHRYDTLWRVFLSGIGCEPVVSPMTDREILENGCRLAPDEACLPVKLHVGHVAALLPGTDVVLVPRIVSLGKREHNCEKFAGSYDLVANILPDARLETYSVDRRWTGERERAGMVALGRRLGAGRVRSLASYERARRVQVARDRAEAREETARLVAERETPSVLVVAHSYNLADEFLGGRAVRLLREQGVRTVSAEALHVRPRHNRVPIARDVYWTYSRELLAGIDRARRHVHGIMFLQTFPCGPDSLVTELCERRIRDIPLLSLMVDEHSSDVGTRTRLECFADIVRARHEAATGIVAEAAR